MLVCSPEHFQNKLLFHITILIRINSSPLIKTFILIGIALHVMSKRERNRDMERL